MQACLQNELLKEIFILVFQILIDSTFVEVKECHTDLKVSPQS